MLDHHRHASETFRWRADDGPFIFVFGSSLPLVNFKKINVVNVDPSGSAHVHRLSVCNISPWHKHLHVADDFSKRHVRCILFTKLLIHFDRRILQF